MSLFDVVLKLHIITGPNGQCMCGTDKDGNVVTCLNILCGLSHEIQSVSIGAHFIEKHGGEPIAQERKEKDE